MAENEKICSRCSGIGLIELNHVRMITIHTTTTICPNCGGSGFRVKGKVSNDKGI